MTGIEIVITAWLSIESAFLAILYMAFGHLAQRVAALEGKKRRPRKPRADAATAPATLI